MKTAYEAGKLMTFRRDGEIQSLSLTSVILDYTLMGYLGENSGEFNCDYGFMVMNYLEGAMVVASSKDGVESFRYLSFG